MLAMGDADVRMFNESRQFNASNMNVCNLPTPEPLLRNAIDMPFFIVGDGTFGLQPLLMKPFQGKQLS